MKGKYKEFLAEAYKQQNIARVVRTLEHMTDINDHGGALLFLAKQLNSSRHVSIMEGIMKIHQAEGSMPSELIKYRTSVMNELLKLAKRNYSKEDYALINGAF